MLDMYSIGEMVIDFIPGSEPHSYIRNAGGAPANVAIAVAKNGLKAGMCTKVGNDDFGHFLMRTLQEYNVQAMCPDLCTEAITTMAFVSLSDNGERVFTFARKPGADMFLSVDDVREQDISNSAIIHAGSCSMSAGPAAEATVRALRLGSTLGRMVSYDVNYRNIMWNDDRAACTRAVLDILKYVDFLKISEEEVDMLGGANMLHKAAKEHGIALIMLTQGKAGATAYWKGKEIFSPATGGKAVDATGAGDSFWGGFLSKLRIDGVQSAADLTEQGIAAAMEYGNVSGGICVMHKGAIPSIPTRAQIEEFLRTNKK